MQLTRDLFAIAKFLSKHATAEVQKVFHCLIRSPISRRFSVVDMATAVNTTATDRRITRAFRLCSLLAGLSSHGYISNPAIASSHHSYSETSSRPCSVRPSAALPRRTTAVLLKAVANSRTFLVLWNSSSSSNVGLLSHSGAIDPSASKLHLACMPSFRLISLLPAALSAGHVQLFVCLAIDKAYTYCHC